MYYLEQDQEPRPPPDWNPYKMASSKMLAPDSPDSDPYKIAPKNMSALDRLSKRLTSTPMSQATTMKKKRYYAPQKTLGAREVWQFYKQDKGSFPVIHSGSSVDDIRRACIYPIASLEQLIWLNILEAGDDSIIYKALIMLEHITGMVDNSYNNEDEGVLKLHVEMVGIINVCRGMNGYQDWYGNGMYGWQQGHGWDLSSGEALEYLGDLLRQWNPRRWRREETMGEPGEQTWTSSAEVVKQHVVDWGQNI
ncbi:hypothetical protein Vi05172_g1572 [Venturia inaequalis]|uniref:Uncharacterized protein n=2 Tax=Venturia inaequalis TaxID=5025 RepID=A0A8H3VL37_VENIN|nr:hypothetical protein EG327_009735 [Venturia inaequalis]RDI88526.1 hypothetical protein Vi05172_g1572 [Venturia inaequalis]